MTWLQYPARLHHDPRIIDAASNAGVHPVTMAGTLMAVCEWMLEFRPTGDLDGVSPQILSTTTGLDISILEALFQSKLIVESQLADWDKIAGPLIKNRELSRNRMVKHREVTRNLRVTSSNVRVSSTHETKTQSKTITHEATPVVPVTPVELSNTTKSTNVDLVADKSAQMPREDQAFFKILAETIPFDPASLTPGNRGKINVAIKNMRTLTKPVTTEELPTLVTEYKTRHPDWEISATAIAENVYKLRQPRASPSSNGSKPRQGGRAVDSVKWEGMR